jgi:hypothetical protein
MGFREDLARIATDPEMLRRAIWRAGSRELAEDALQETVRAIAERKRAGPIDNLPGFFYIALIHEIDRQLGRRAAIPAGDISAISDQSQAGASVAGPQHTSVEGDVHVRILAVAVLAALEGERACNGLAKRVPARSEDPGLYQYAIFRVAKMVFALLLEGHVTPTDWNAILKAAYPQWCDEPGLPRDTRDQRLSRARRDVQSLLRSVLSREDLAS